MMRPCAGAVFARDRQTISQNNFSDVPIQLKYNMLCRFLVIVILYSSPKSVGLATINTVKVCIYIVDNEHLLVYIIMYIYCYCYYYFFFLILSVYLSNRDKRGSSSWNGRFAAISSYDILYIYFYRRAAATAHRKTRQRDVSISVSNRPSTAEVAETRSGDVNRVLTVF